MANTFKQLTTSTPGRIAVTRTMAPMLWAVLSEWALSNLGIDLAQKIADIDGAGGIGVTQATSLATSILFAVIYLGGRYVPQLERLLLGVKVEAQDYTV